MRSMPLLALPGRAAALFACQHGARACTHPNLPCCAADEGVQLEGLDEDDGEMMEVDVTGAWYTTRSVSWV